MKSMTRILTGLVALGLLTIGTDAAFARGYFSAGNPGGSTATFTVIGAPASGTSRSANANVVPVASDFSLGVEKPAPLPAGTSVAISVGTLPLGVGASEAIALSFQGTAGLTGSFSPATVVAGGSSTLTLSAAPDLGDATWTVTVIGTAPSAAHRAALDVKVLARTTAGPSPSLAAAARGCASGADAGIAQALAALAGLRAARARRDPRSAGR